MGETNRVIYGDDPGTGKTATTLRWLASTAQTALVVAPKNVLGHWQREASVWTPDLVVVRGDGTPSRRAGARQEIESRRVDGAAGPALLLLNFEIVHKDVEALIALKFDTVAVDEAHRLKSRSALVTKAMRKITRRADNLALVTGTPILNRPEEAWSLLNLIDPKHWSSYWNWVRQHCEVTEETFYGRQVPIVGKMRDGALEAIKSELGPKLIRRPIEQLLPDLPAVTDIMYPVQLKPAERKRYDAMAKHAWMEAGGDIVTASNKITQMTRLRQLVGGWDSDDDASTKVLTAAEIIEDLAPERVLVLTAYKHPAYELSHMLGEEARVITGDQEPAQRAECVRRFQEDDDEVRVIVGTIGALGEGIDGLQVAHHVIMLDLDWTPARNTQAIARIRRSGQESDRVVVHHVYAEDTIDQLVAEANERKMSVIDAIVGVPIELVLQGRVA